MATALAHKPTLRYVPVKPASRAAKPTPAAKTKVHRAKARTQPRAAASSSYRPTDPRLAELWGINDRTRSGIVVDDEKAMTWSAFYAAISLISESLAILPRKIFKSGGAKSDEDAGDRNEVRRHPGWKAMNRSPDGVRTSYSWIETMTRHACVSGNGFSEIVRNGRGQGNSYHLLNPYNVRIEIKDDGLPLYIVTEKSREKKLQSFQVMHLRAPSWDGLIGQSPVTRARETIALGLAAEVYGSTFFGKGGRPAGFITKPNRVSKKERETLQAEWEEMHGGLDNALQVGVLSGGLDWKAVGMSNEDAQFLATRKFQVLEICRWFRIPPHMLSEMDGTKYDSVEQMLIEFVTFTMLPWIKRWESEFNMKAFTPDEQFTHYCEFQLDGLLRADVKSRSESMEIQLRNGTLTPDEWRKLENRPAYPDGIGNKPLIMASQMLTLEAVANGETMLGKPGDGSSPDPAKKPAPKKAVKKKPASTVK